MNAKNDATKTVIQSVSVSPPPSLPLIDFPWAFFFPALLPTPGSSFSPALMAAARSCFVLAISVSLGPVLQPKISADDIIAESDPNTQIPF
jgi:hypothetical protein